MKPRSLPSARPDAFSASAVARLVAIPVRALLGAAALGLSVPLVSAAPATLRPLVTPNPSDAALTLYASLEARYGVQPFSGDNGYVHTPDVFSETGKQAALRNYDLSALKTDANLAAVVRDYHQNRRIISMQWHWGLAGDAVKRVDRTKRLDAWCIQNGKLDTRGLTVDQDILRQVITAGTPLNLAYKAELKDAADKLVKLRDAGVPVLFRPLHEIDGGWFWWTLPQSTNGADTVALWNDMFKYLAVDRQLNNLIWVWSMGKNFANTPANVAYSASYYPGNDKVDIVGVDLYRYSTGGNIPSVGYDLAKLAASHADHWNILSTITGGTLPNGQTKKMFALCETAFHHPGDKMADGTLPKWLYVMPWFGGPGRGDGYNTSVYGEIAQMNSGYYLTADELPANFVQTPAATFNNFTPTNPADDVPVNILPFVQITSPVDDGQTLYQNDQPPTITVAASDRDGSVSKVEYYALTVGDRDDYKLGALIGSKTAAPYDFTWTAWSPNNTAGWQPGTYTLVAVATDNAGGVRASNPVHVTVGVANIAANKATSAQANPADSFEAVNDRVYYTPDGIDPDSWTGAPDQDSQWWYVDLGKTFTFDEINTIWAWKGSPEQYQLQIAQSSPDLDASWITVFDQLNAAKHSDFKQTNRDLFNPVSARYVRFLGVKRDQNYKGARYNLMSFEIPVPGVSPTADISSQPQFTQCQPENASLPVSTSTSVAFRFDLGAYPATITSAKLRVYKNAGGAATTLTVYPATSDNFTEASGATFPAVGAAIQSQATAAVAQWVEFDVTASVASQLAPGGDKVASFVIKGSTTSWAATLSTRNASANLPQLIVTP